MKQYLPWPPWCDATRNRNNSICVMLPKVAKAITMVIVACCCGQHYRTKLCQCKHSLSSLVMLYAGNTKEGGIPVPSTSCLTGLESMKNRLIQTSQTGGQQYSDTSPFSIPCYMSTTYKNTDMSVVWVYCWLYLPLQYLFLIYANVFFCCFSNTDNNNKTCF